MTYSKSIPAADFVIVIVSLKLEDIRIDGSVLLSSEDPTIDRAILGRRAATPGSHSVVFSGMASQRLSTHDDSLATIKFHSCIPQVTLYLVFTLASAVLMLYFVCQHADEVASCSNCLKLASKLCFRN